jgi:hypothetical protein
MTDRVLVEGPMTNRAFVGGPMTNRAFIGSPLMGMQLIEIKISCVFASVARGMPQEHEVIPNARQDRRVMDLSSWPIA